LTVKDVEAWMGYWLAPWAVHGVSPLWFQLLGRPIEKRLEAGIVRSLPDLNPRY